MNPTIPSARSFPRSRPALTLALGVALTLGGASAQGAARLDLAGAVRQALTTGPDVRTARANLDKAEANLAAVRADPTTLAPGLTAAQQGFASAQSALRGARLSTMQAVVNQYTAVFETQERAEVGAAQVNLSDRNLRIAQARLAARNATQLDVNRAQNTLATDRQELANARAQLPVLEAQLVRTLGLPAGTNVTVTAPPTPPRLTATSATLARGVDSLPSVIGAAQAVESATLQVRLADNDYTPRRTLEDARVSLANAQRDLDTARRAAQTALRDAERAVSDATERVTLARQALANGRTNLTQTETRFRNGTAASVDVQTARVSTQNAELNLTVATDTLWKALAALSVASGSDVTGLVGSGGDQ